MNTMEKQALMDAILTRCPSARFTITCDGFSQEEAKDFTRELSRLLGVEPKFKASNRMDWFRVENNEVSVGVFFNRPIDEPYMIEDVVMTIEESSEV